MAKTTKILKGETAKMVAVAQPNFSHGVHAVGRIVVSDSAGKLWHIDADSGIVRPVSVRA